MLNGKRILRHPRTHFQSRLWWAGGSERRSDAKLAHFRKNKCRRAACSERRPIFMRKADCLHIYEHIQATGANEVVQVLSDLLNTRLHDDVQ